MLLNLEETQHKCAKAKAGKCVSFLTKLLLWYSSWHGYIWGWLLLQGLLSHGKAFCLLWHLQYFSYWCPDEVPSCTMAVDSGDPPKAGYRNIQLLPRPKAHWEVSSLLFSQQHQGKGKKGIHPLHWPWREKEVDADGKSTADAWGELFVSMSGRCTNSPRVQLWTGRVTFLTPNLNIAGLSPSAFPRPRACGISSLGVSRKAVLTSPLSEQRAGICWSEKGGIGNASSTGPARRAEELLWVLWSLLGRSAERRLGGRVGLWTRTHFSWSTGLAWSRCWRSCSLCCMGLPRRPGGCPFLHGRCRFPLERVKRELLWACK